MVCAAGCNKNDANGVLCSYLKVADMNHAILFMDEFLSDLPDDLDKEQKLDALAKFLKLQPCIHNADVLLFESYDSNSLSEIIFSFDENGITKVYVLFVSMTDPLTVACYEEFCGYYYAKYSYLSRTLPIINFFLDGLPDNLNEEKKMQTLIKWLKEKTCIINAEVLCQSCIQTEPPISEIAILFDLNKEEYNKDLILDISMTNPLNVIGYRSIDDAHPRGTIIRPVRTEAVIDFFNIGNIIQFFFLLGNFDEEKLLLINNVDEFKNNFNDPFSPSLTLPAIDFDSYTLIISKHVNSRGGFPIIDSYIVVGSEELIFNIRQKDIGGGRLFSDAAYSWGLYPKIKNKSIDINIITYYF